MSAPGPAETAVASFGLMFALIGVDDPAVQWLQQNGVRVGLVGFCSSFVAFVLCLEFPPATFRQFVGRILASGVCGSVATAIAGSVHASGTGPAVTGFIVIFIGVGGIYILLAMRQYFESKQASGELVGWFGRLVERILDQLDRFFPRSQPQQKGPTDVAGPGTSAAVRPIDAHRGPNAGGNAAEPGQRLSVEPPAT